MATSIKERFASDHNLSLLQVNKLCGLANRYVEAYTTANNCTVRTLDATYAAMEQKRVKAFEEFAAQCGFHGVDWPGLYPTLTKDDHRFIALPLD